MSDQSKPSPKPSAKIDFGVAADVTHQRPQISPSMTQAGVEDARKVGFATRADPVKIDRRTLRRSVRTTQLNMKLTPAVHTAFKEASLDFATTEEFMVHLLKLHHKHR
jgi:hypothetical protein